MDFITFNTLQLYQSKGKIVHLSSRKHLACIDRTRYFKVSAGTVNKWFCWQKTGIKLIN